MTRQRIAIALILGMTLLPLSADTKEKEAQRKTYEKNVNQHYATKAREETKYQAKRAEANKYVPPPPAPRKK